MVVVMSKHTPGPWNVQERESSFRVVDHRALKFDNSRLCDVQHWSGATRGPDRDESRANARLMAAAPDLLRWLRFAVKVLKPVYGHTYQFEQMQAVIAKAEGKA